MYCAEFLKIFPTHITRCFLESEFKLVIMKSHPLSGYLYAPNRFLPYIKPYPPVKSRWLDEKVHLHSAEILFRPDFPGKPGGKFYPC
jgi:hypothetical protein